MTSSFKVMARVMITPGREGAFEKYATELSLATGAEEGCLSYRLHRNLNQKGVYVFIEEWASPQLWERHMSGDAIRLFNTQLPPGTIAHIEIHLLEQIA
ncbi:putative quinol monooxygenase [Agrobacterium sp. SOY23]|uniref:putative quinol monooxygenase n=1 Tax=Agrobacterium sp. SOY23 TaxID=3014555 RepID=UPI0022B02FA8|nr:putative quinol monooxygenase [Agrobacterium sp. SOY23]MCZ4431252.1 putative quinol monooxygenase [Agrobacterium sp. SOY23]